MILKISTLNIRGFNNKNKICFINDFLLEKNVDVCFMQETHINDQNTANFIKETFILFDVFFSLTKKSSGGVAIFIRKERGMNVLCEYFDSENRMHGVEVCLNSNGVFNFITIYAPNTYVCQNEFIQELYKYLSGKKNIILGGDFNFNFSNRENERSNIKNWKNFYNNFNLCEFEWCVPNTAIENCYTWSNGNNLKSRIDRFYCDSLFLKNCVYKEIFETSMSDHKMVVCEIDVDKNIKKRKKTGLWKLNESVLENDSVSEGIVKICETIPKIKSEEKINWYDTFINKICCFLKKQSRTLNNLKKEKINSFFQQLKECDEESECEDLNRKKNGIREQINAYYEEKRRGNEVRVRNERMKFIKQPTKVLLNEEKKSNVSCMIDKYETADGHKTDRINIIRNDIYNFYNNLLGVDTVNDEKINNYQFKINSMNVGESIKEIINRKISVNEAEKVIKDMKVSAPGSTGLTIGFYKKYFQYFGEYFVAMLNSDDELPLLFKESIVKLIPKNNNKVKTINDLRPISLTNIDYRIYTKILANRLRIVSNLVIGDHQTCSIKGRRINDNINLIRDVIFESNNTGSELFLLSVDQSKAFDRISHKYLFKLLEHMNFGSFILNSVKKIYNKSYCKIVVNNTLSENVMINSGLKQGCALSMLLYILCIEELIVRIKNNSLIKGIVVNAINRYECKAGGYADDICGFIKDYNCINVFFNEFKQWGTVSSAILNVDKTKILALNSGYSEYNNIKFTNQLKVLGIEFNKNGVMRENVDKVINKIEKSVNIWDGVYLNTLERVIVSKTFILSKLWYVMNFICMNESEIKRVDLLIHKFIWNNSFEMIKRNTLCLPYESGGLNTVCLRAKLKTIQVQNFINIYLNRERMFYQLSVKYLKFELRETNIFKNFNLIPVTFNKQKIHKRMIESMNTFKKCDPEFLLERNKKATSKYIYNKLLKNYQVQAKVEKLNPFENWEQVYRKIHEEVNSDVRVFLYKLLFEALPVNNRFFNKKNKCFFCNKAKEEVTHVFFECSITRNLFNLIVPSLDNNSIYLNKHSFWFSIEITKHDYKMISIFLYTAWLLRERLRRGGTISNIAIIFERIFKKNIS